MTMKKMAVCHVHAIHERSKIELFHHTLPRAKPLAM